MIFLSAVALGLHAWIGGDLRAQEADQAEVYRWLDSLHLGFLNAPIVEVDLSGGAKEYGFLVRSGKANFEIVSYELIRERFDSSAKYRAVSLADWLAGNLDAVPSLPAGSFSVDGAGYPAASGVLPVVLSYVAAKHGLASLSALEFGRAYSRDRPTPIVDGKPLWPSFPEWFKTTLAEDRGNQLLRDLTDPLFSRQDLLAEAGDYLKQFPGSANEGSVREIVERIGEEVNEAATHRMPDPKSATPDQLIADDIYRLQTFRVARS